VLTPAWCPAPGLRRPPWLHRTLPSGAAREGSFRRARVHEIKFNGYVTQAHLQAGRLAIYTRAGYDWTLPFQPIADYLSRSGDRPDPGWRSRRSRGIPDFGLLHAKLAAGRQDRPLYSAFDLPLRRAPGPPKIGCPRNANLQPVGKDIDSIRKPWKRRRLDQNSRRPYSAAITGTPRSMELRDRPLPRCPSHQSCRQHRVA
jgi:hypothetical protein